MNVIKIFYVYHRRQKKIEKLSFLFIHKNEYIKLNLKKMYINYFNMINILRANIYTYKNRISY